MCLADLFRSKNDKESDAERDFKHIVEIVKKYDKPGFTKLMEAVQQVWAGYDTVLRTKTRQEKDDIKQAKEDKDIADTESKLEFLETKGA